MSNRAIESMKWNISYGIALVPKTFSLKELRHKDSALLFVLLIVFLEFFNLLSSLLSSCFLP